MNPDTMKLAQQSEQDLDILIKEGHFPEAEVALRQTLSQGTGPIATWKMLAHVLWHQKKFEEARDIRLMLLKNVPGDLPLRFDIAESCLMLGDFDRGWREYRHRYGLPHTKKIERRVQLPRWNGQRIEGQTLLIHDEQGHGDTFQFMRLLPLAKERSGAIIVFEVSPEVLPLAQRMPGIDIITQPGMLPPPGQYHCELMSLPMALGLTFSDLPVSTSYLTPDTLKLEKWQQRLAALPHPLVALVWGGRPTPYPDRSMSLEQLAPLGDAKATFLSIQKGPHAEQAKNPPEGLSVINLDEEIKDFDDTAAILCVADLLISIDSAPLHLGGALGRPAWGMLMHVADWRWFPDRDDSPWYPSLRLFRQTKRKVWTDVVERVRAALQSL